MLASDAATDKLKEMDLSKDELDRLEKAFKDAEFRKLFVDYMQEISDPDNRKLYEAEIAKLEKERGNDIKWVKPDPAFVVKTKCKSTGQKVFINICTSAEMSKATFTMTGTRGQNWSIPYSLAQGRPDVDKSGAKCVVYDFVIHPETLGFCSTSTKFKAMVIDTAFEGIMKQFQTQLQTTDYRLPKMKSKGQLAQTVIRTATKASEKGKESNTSLDDLKKLLAQNNSSSALQENSSFEQPSPLISTATSQKKEPLIEELSTSDDITPSGPKQPQYEMIHRGEIDLADYTHARSKQSAGRPKELVVKVHLPTITSMAHATLDIEDRHIHLAVQPLYLLELDLPYAVQAQKGNAKFDKSKSQLTITLPVEPAQPVEIPQQQEVDVINDSDQETHEAITEESHNDQQSLSDDSVKPFEQRDEVSKTGISETPASLDEVSEPTESMSEENPALEQHLDALSQHQGASIPSVELSATDLLYDLE